MFSRVHAHTRTPACMATGGGDEIDCASNPGVGDGRAHRCKPRAPRIDRAWRRAVTAPNVVTS
ncbi:hypothetical protein WS83_22185 [Burkholderia sp. MSMB2042]|nr:hypothetical protein WS83_22185 [Burkholderia sp. MSMB2042]